MRAVQWGMMILLGVVPLVAQEKPVPAPPPVKIEAAKPDAVPTVDETTALKLDNQAQTEMNLQLQIENFQLKVVWLQGQLDKHRAKSQAFVKTLDKPGFTLGHDAAGAWTYTKAK